MPPTNYIYVDYENVSSGLDLSLIGDKPVKVVLVTGMQQKTVPKGLLHWAAEGKLIPIEVTAGGKNALDFVLACELGIKSAAEPEAYFHIVSKDTGFDALVAHLKGKHLHIARHEAFADIPLLKKPAPEKTAAHEPVPAIAGRVKRLAEILAKPKANRPAKEKTLRTFINSLFGKKLSDAEITKTVKALQAAKVLTIDPKGGVAYRLNRA